MVILSAGTWELNEVIAMLGEFAEVVCWCGAVSGALAFTGRDIVYNVLDGDRRAGALVTRGVTTAHWDYDNFHVR